MAQAGSALSVASNPSMARPNSKEWSSATARLNCAWAGAVHEVAKATVPSFPSLPCSCSCAAAIEVAVNATVNAIESVIPVPAR
jgi:hypothetical protein